MNTQVEISVNGKPVKQYTHQNNIYIEARAGTEYTIKVKNDAYQRKLAVITVDGLNVITGKPQVDGIGQGYIVGSRDAITIRGFRQDMETVGAFKFCKKSGAYCNEQGLKGNNGVIGVRIYDEDMASSLGKFMKDSSWGTLVKGKCMPQTTNPWDSGKIMYSHVDSTSYTRSCATMDSQPVVNAFNSSTSSPDFDLGTTWGQKVNDNATYTEFEANKSQFEDHIVYYDTRENLETIGVTFTKTVHVNFPKAFGAFATPPKGWKG